MREIEFSSLGNGNQVHSVYSSVTYEPVPFDFVAPFLERAGNVFSS